jgi:hypothetical protein
VNVSYVTHVYGDPVPVRYTFALTTTGEVSVVTPEWVSTARERTAGS